VNSPPDPLAAAMVIFHLEHFIATSTNGWTGGAGSDRLFVHLLWGGEYWA